MTGHSRSLSPWLKLSFAEWASGNRSSQVRWSKGDTGQSIYLEIQLQNPQQNSEYENQALDGTAYYAISAVSIIMFHRSVHAQRVRSHNLTSPGKSTLLRPSVTSSVRTVSLRILCPPRSHPSSRKSLPDGPCHTS